MSDIRRARLRCWSDVVAWTLIIYSTLYIVRPICEFLKANTPFELIVNVVMYSILFSVAVFSFQKKIFKSSSWILIAFVFLAYVVVFIWLKIPEEKIHLIEYGILAFLIFRAAVLDFGETRSYAISFVLASLIGWGDEGIQYLLPNRYYEWHDVFINCISVMLGLFLLFSFRRRKV